MDLTEGIIARFRTMAIPRAAVLTGHVVGSALQTLLGIAVVIGVAFVIGFRPTAGPIEWLAAIGVLTVITFALTWLSVALGMVIETLRGLLTGAPIGNSGLLTVTWCVVIALGGYLWARALHTRNSTR